MQMARQAFRGLKVTQDQGAADQFGLRRVTLIHQDRLQLRRGHVGGGGNGAFQALDMVLSWGIREVLLVGVDARDHEGLNHWHGAHGKACTIRRERVRALGQSILNREHAAR